MAPTSEDADDREENFCSENVSLYRCCKGKPHKCITCIKCGSVYHKSCANRYSHFKIIDASRLVCCDAQSEIGDSIQEQTQAGGRDTEKSIKDQADEHEVNPITCMQIDHLKRENELLIELMKQSEEKNHILRQNNGLLLEKIASLQKTLHQHQTSTNEKLTIERDGNIFITENEEFDRLRKTKTRQRYTPTRKTETDTESDAERRRYPTTWSSKVQNCQLPVMTLTAPTIRQIGAPTERHRDQPRLSTSDRNVLTETDFYDQQVNKNVNKSEGRISHNGNRNVNPNQNCGKNETENKSIQQGNDSVDTDTEEAGYKLVTRKRRMRKQKVGTSDNSNEESLQEFQARNYKKPEDKKLWLFISRAKASVDETIVKNYIAKKGVQKLEDISVKLLQTRTKLENNNCFMVGVPLDMKESIYKHEFWPQGVQFQRFNFKVGQHFLTKTDIPPETQKTTK